MACPREDRDILQHSLAAIAEAGALTADDLQRSTQLLTTRVATLRLQHPQQIKALAALAICPARQIDPSWS